MLRIADFEIEAFHNCCREESFLVRDGEIKLLVSDVEVSEEIGEKQMKTIKASYHCFKSFKSEMLN
jgi:hypothetical protein